MADLPIASDEGAPQVEVVQSSTQNRLAVKTDGGIISSLGTAAGKTVVMKTGSLTTTAVTADQVVLTYTVTALKTFFVEYVMMEGGQTTPAGNTVTILGIISTETPSGTKVISTRLVGGGSTLNDLVVIPFAEPIPILAGTVVRVVVTPNSTVSMLWRANFGGYEI